MRALGSLPFLPHLESFLVKFRESLWSPAGAQEQPWRIPHPHWRIGLWISFLPMRTSLGSLWLSWRRATTEIRKTHFWNMALTRFPVWRLGSLTGVPCWSPGPAPRGLASFPWPLTQSAAQWVLAEERRRHDERRGGGSCSRRPGSKWETHLM